MTISNIPLDKAELLSMLLEGVLYGISLPMFGGTIWAPSRRATGQINCKMLMVACSLLLCSTVHLVICSIRIMQGLILFRDTFPGGPIGYFSDVLQWTFVSKNCVYTVQTLIGDGVILYRCCVVWRSKFVMILAVLLWCAVVVTGIAAPSTESQVRQNGVFGGSLSQWITSFWASTLITNLFATLLLAYRIWHVDHKTTSSFGHRRIQLRPILYIILDAGIIYSLTLLTALICFINRSNGQYVILDMITPIISITFYMVIIRVGITNRANEPTNTHAVGYATTGNNIGADRRSRMQAIVSSFDNSVGNGRRSPTNSGTPVAMDNHQSENKLDDVAEAV